MSEENPYDKQLKSVWTLYIDPKNFNKAYKYKIVDGFEKINNIGKFWESILYLSEKNINDPDTHNDYFFMRDGILPLWEDKANEHGGSFSIKLDCSKSHQCWTEIAIALISNFYPELNDVNGLQCSIKKTAPFYSGMSKNFSKNSVQFIKNEVSAYIKIWTKDSSKKNGFFPEDIFNSFLTEYKQGTYIEFADKGNFKKTKMSYYSK